MKQCQDQRHAFFEMILYDVFEFHYSRHIDFVIRCKHCGIVLCFNIRFAIVLRRRDILIRSSSRVPVRMEFSAAESVELARSPGFLFFNVGLDIFARDLISRSSCLKCLQDLTPTSCAIRRAEGVAFGFAAELFLLRRRSLVLPGRSFWSNGFFRNRWSRLLCF